MEFEVYSFFLGAVGFASCQNELWLLKLRLERHRP